MMVVNTSSLSKAYIYWGKRDIGVDPLDFLMIVAATIFWLQFFPSGQL